jgi:hypothetical protein
MCPATHWPELRCLHLRQCDLLLPSTPARRPRRSGMFLLRRPHISTTFACLVGAILRARHPCASHRLLLIRSPSILGVDRVPLDSMTDSRWPTRAPGQLAVQLRLCPVPATVSASLAYPYLLPPAFPLVFSCSCALPSSSTSPASPYSGCPSSSGSTGPLPRPIRLDFYNFILLVPARPHRSPIGLLRCA